MSEREAHIHNEEREENQLWSEIQSLEGAERAETLMDIAEQALNRPGGARDALSTAEEALAIWEAMGVLAPSVEIASAMTLIANAQESLRQNDEAIETLERAIEIQRRSTSYYLDDSLRSLARLYTLDKQYDKAISLLLESVTLNEIDGSLQYYTADLLQLALVYSEAEMWQEVLETSERALVTAKKHQHLYHAGLCYMYKTLALAELGDSQNAILFGTRALDIGRMTVGFEITLRAQYALGVAQSRSGNYEEAEAALYEAEQMVHADLEYKFLAKIKKESIRIYRESGKTEELEIEERRLQTLLEIVG